MSISQINASQLRDMLDNDDILLVDVREREEYAVAHISEAKLMPLSEFHTHVAELKKETRKIVFQCKAGGRSQQAAEAIEAQGIQNDLFNLAGGIEGWIVEGLDTQSE